MKNDLTQKEIDAIIMKLRNRYEEYEKKYGASFFNKKSFEKRYLEALKNKMNLKVFAYAEVEAFEEMKKRFEQKQEEYRIKTERPFSKKIDKMYEQFLENISKYPQLFSDTELFLEGQYFCGALLDFYNNFWVTLTKFIDNNNLSILKNFNSISNKIGNFIFSTKLHPPLEVENYLLNLKKNDIDKSRMIFFKSGISVISDIKKFLHKNIKMISDKEKKEAVQICLDMINDITTDFRLTDLVKNKIPPID